MDHDSCLECGCRLGDHSTLGHCLRPGCPCPGLRL